MQRQPIGHFVGAFFDICGQRRKMSEIPKILTPQNIEEARGAISRVFEEVETVRSWFRDFHKQALEPPENRFEDPSEQTVFTELMKTDLKFREFSDGLLAYVSLLGHERANVPVNGIWAILSAAGGICQLGLAHGIPVRVGIDLSWGAFEEDGGIYGRVLADAYDLESKVAKFPRAVVGDGLIGYLNTAMKEHGEDAEVRVSRELAGLCRSVISQDDNGVMFVDHLGKAFQNASPHEYQEEINEMIMRFVSSEVERFQGLGESDLYEKYSELKEYVDSRIRR